METNRTLMKVWRWTKNSSAFVSLFIGVINLIIVAWMILDYKNCEAIDCGPGAIGVGFVILAYGRHGWIIPVIGAVIGVVGIFSKFKIPAIVGLFLSIVGFIIYLLLLLLVTASII